jgi:hypothetical protein
MTKPRPEPHWATRLSASPLSEFRSATAAGRDAPGAAFTASAGGAATTARRPVATPASEYATTRDDPWSIRVTGAPSQTRSAPSCSAIRSAISCDPQDDDVIARRGQFPGRGQPGQARPDHDHSGLGAAHGDISGPHVHPLRMTSCRVARVIAT